MEFHGLNIQTSASKKQESKQERQGILGSGERGRESVELCIRNVKVRLRVVHEGSVEDPSTLRLVWRPIRHSPTGADHQTVRSLHLTLTRDIDTHPKLTQIHPDAPLLAGK
jgi:hypothetical protein